MRKICKKKMNGKHIYDEKRLILIISCFLITGISLSFLYNYWYIRYIILVIITVIGLIKKNYIKTFINEMLNINKKKVS